MYIFPSLDPIAVHLGPIGIRWYALMYIFGFIFCLLYFSKYYLKKFTAPFNTDDLSDIATLVFLGILFGGRIGYVLFYNFSYFLTHPLEIPAVWQGGLSFHGGLVGVIIALLIFCKKKKYHPIAFADSIVLPIPIAIGIGRIGNFINGELWGRPSPDETFCMVFPHVDTQCRYPTQLFESFGEGIVLFCILQLFLHCTKSKDKQGTLFGIFLLGYGLIRFIVEYYREPDAQLGLFFGSISMGQILSLPVLIAGMYFIFFYGKKTSAVGTSN